MGLIRGMARTAVIAGTATAVSNGVSRRQYSKWEQQAAEQQQQQAPPQQQAPQAAPAAASAPAEESMDDKIAQIQKLAQLHEQGILTDDEFAAQKAKLLG